MNDSQSWALIGLLAVTYAGQLLDARRERRELRDKLDAMDDRIGGRLGVIEVMLARIDERLAAVEPNP